VKPPEKPATVFYRLGLTDNNRVAFSMGYSEITMNQAGVDNLIQQLQVFRNQLHDEDNGTNNDPDGGLPLPEEVPYDKAA
jgi:hypothetical protein